VSNLKTGILNKVCFSILAGGDSMKKGLFLLVVVMMISISLFSEGMLGLRTVKATQTETEETPQQKTGLKLDLRTIDPLLQAFRDGFKSPDLPGWKVQKVGSKTVKVPEGFSLKGVQNGMNVDAEILDGNGKRFAQLFVYELQAYELTDLYDTLMQTLYADEIADDKEFEEFKAYEGDLCVYFTRQTMLSEKVSMPVFFIYAKDETVEAVKSGTVVFLFVEPFDYQGEADMEDVNKWVEGIAGSLIDSMNEGKKAAEETGKVQKDEKQERLPKDEFTGDDFGSMAANALQKQLMIEEIPYNWTIEQANYFSLMRPYELSVELYEGEGFEVMDFAYSGTTVAKLFVGTADEAVDTDEILDQLYDDYLKGLGTYTLIKETPYLSDGAGFLTTYELGFQQYRCWVTLYSEAEEEGVVNGEYLLLLAIAPENEVDEWKDIYLNILLSVTF